MTTYEIEHYNVYDTPNNNWVSTFPRYYMPVQLEVCKDSSFSSLTPPTYHLSLCLRAITEYLPG